jgi:lipoprotein-releasing system ATP-binding protein
MNNFLLQFVNIEKTYKSGDAKLQILHDINFALVKGETVAITGRSGSGKSTFLNIAGSLDRPSKGEVFLLEQKLSSLNDKELSYFRNNHIGFIFQAHILLEDFNALENVAIPALIKGVKRSYAFEKATSLLEKVGLKERLKHKSSQLSGGERQRVAICRALINEADLIIADEPTGSLDEKSAQEIEDLLFELVEEQKRTLLMVTHNEKLANRCSKVYVLQNRGLTAI